MVFVHVFFHKFYYIFAVRHRAFDTVAEAKLYNRASENVKIDIALGMRFVKPWSATPRAVSEHD